MSAKGQKQTCAQALLESKADIDLPDWNDRFVPGTDFHLRAIWP